MTLPEFKSWLEGFSEAINNTPTEEQWNRILAKLNDVHEPFNAPIFNYPPNKRGYDSGYSLKTNGEPGLQPYRP